MEVDRIARFFEQEVSRCRPFMQAHARKYLKNEEVIKDIVQESLLKLYYRLTDPDSIKLGVFSMNVHYAWLLTVIKNAALDYHKEQKRFQQLDPAEALAILEARGRSEPSPEMALTYRETRDDLLSLLQAIPLKERKVLYHHLYQGMSFEEIACQWARSSDTVRSWYFRGRKHLKQIVTRKVTPADLLLLIEHSVMREES